MTVHGLTAKTEARGVSGERPPPAGLDDPQRRQDLAVDDAAVGAPFVVGPGDSRGSAAVHLDRE
ncbi:MAG TPA: hypothetical protein VF587_16040 [Solirubrobacteraceae bacterium]|jgi:hypothetical protein